ncbi:MAG: hypothetical protein K0Q79_2483 [Flavipsychrobacter sp.]|jgi:predicted transcriptional regulator|nr:hypothetical protein [Flavipsychrobacter sp.]
MSLGKSKKVNLAFSSATSMSKEELVKMIKEAEKGPFYSTEEVKQDINKWSKKYNQAR